MIILQENEVCPFASQCFYNSTGNCVGSKSNRQNKFTCDYVVNGQIIEGQPARLAGDKTGKMKVIME